ncbi:MAG: YkgJ family cysteine cluster protein [Acidobacteriales bacterium]|nr:YkgJ family cysteine cluster protein [Terriglobales bacterium]
MPVQSVIQIEAGDRQLLANIAEAVAEVSRRSGDWLVCRPGCIECCKGPFAITQLDALRLREGLRTLSVADPPRAERVRRRAAEYVAAITPNFPGDPVTGVLSEEDAFPEAMDDIPCPALDPDTGCCDLYGARPITCRTFGPVMWTGEGSLGACELCYDGATDEEKIRCAVDIDPEGLEAELLAGLDALGLRGMTIVAFVLVSAPSTHPA